MSVLTGSMFVSNTWKTNFSIIEKTISIPILFFPHVYQRLTRKLVFLLLRDGILQRGICICVTGNADRVCKIVCIHVLLLVSSEKPANRAAQYKAISNQHRNALSIIRRSLSPPADLCHLPRCTLTLTVLALDLCKCARAACNPALTTK